MINLPFIVFVYEFVAKFNILQRFCIKNNGFAVILLLFGRGKNPFFGFLDGNTGFIKVGFYVGL